MIAIMMKVMEVSMNIVLITHYTSILLSILKMMIMMGLIAFGISNGREWEK